MKNIVLKILAALNWRSRFEPGGVIKTNWEYNGFDADEMKIRSLLTRGIDGLHPTACYPEIKIVETPGSGGQCELKLSTAPAPLGVDPRLTEVTAQFKTPSTFLPDTEVWRVHAKPDSAPNFLSALARVKSAFGAIDYKQLKGGVIIEDNYIVVTLDNYYSIEAIRDCFGKVEFVALDYLPPGPELPFDYSAVKKFQVLNWIMERDN